MARITKGYWGCSVYTARREGWWCAAAAPGHKNPIYRRDVFWEAGAVAYQRREPDVRWPVMSHIRVCVHPGDLGISDPMYRGTGVSMTHRMCSQIWV